MKAIEKLRDAYENFHNTIAEGNYRIQPKSLWTLLTGQGRRAQSNDAATLMGSMMLDTGRAFGGKLMWAGAIALASMQAMVWVSGVLVVAGAGLFGLEFVQSRRARKEIITEVNFAGQQVQGTRGDLYHLHAAQVKIMNLAGSFKQASMESTSETIQHIVDSVAEYSARVKIIDHGRYGASCSEYEFSEPGIKLVKDRPAPPIIFQASSMLPVAMADTSALNDLSIKSSFDAAAFTADEIAKRFLALEQALPADAMAKVNAARKAQKPALKSVA